MDALEAWSEFGVTVAGAAGALAGLVIVAMSVNIEVIVSSKSLPSREGASVASLILAVVAGLLLLVPDAQPWQYGAEVLAGTAVLWILQGLASVQTYRNAHASKRMRAMQLLTGVLPPVAFTVGGLMLVAGAAGGVHVVALACILAIVVAVLSSWVTLGEGRR